MKEKKRILIATDGSDFSQVAVEKACEFITAHETEVVCLSTFENPGMVAIDPSFVSFDYYQVIIDDLRNAAESFVSDAEKQIRTHFSAKEVPVFKEVVEGFADKEIVEKAKEWHADLVVVGSHGRGFWGRLLGSVSSGVVNHAPCSVMVVRRSENGTDIDRKEKK